MNRYWELYFRLQTLIRESQSRTAACEADDQKLLGWLLTAANLTASVQLQIDQASETQGYRSSRACMTGAA